MAPVLFLLNGFVGDGGIVARADAAASLLDLELDVHSPSLGEFHAPTVVVASEITTDVSRVLQMLLPYRCCCLTDVAVLRMSNRCRCLTCRVGVP